MSGLTAHWELKLVALVIALGLWQYTNGQVRVDRTIRVVVSDAAVQSLSAGRYQVTRIEPREFTVHVSTPTNLEGTFRTDGLVPRLVVDADELDKGRQEFPLGNRALGLHDDIRIVFDIDTPRFITVAWDRVEDGYLPVEPPRLDKVPAGLEATIALDRTRIKVSGARSRMEELRQEGHRVRFMPIALDDVDPHQAGSREERLVLKDQDPLVRTTEDVHATITLRPRAGAPRIVSLPLAVLVPQEMVGSGRLQLEPERVVLTLRGPENLLSALAPEKDLAVFVRLRQQPDFDATVELPVELLAPPWLSADPVLVKVTRRQK